MARYPLSINPLLALEAWGSASPPAALVAAFTIGIATLTAGQSLSFSATASGGKAPYAHTVQAENVDTGAVTQLGTASTPGYTSFWQNVPAGTYDLSDTVLDSAGASKKSAVRRVVVSAAALVTPDPPVVVYSSSTRKLTVTPSPAGTVLYSYQGSAFVEYLGAIQVDNLAHDPQDWRFKRAASTGYAESPISYSPAIAVAAASTKNLFFIYPGNSLFASTVNGMGNLPAYITSNARAYLNSIGDARTITDLNLGVNGFDNTRLNQYFESGFNVGAGLGAGQAKPLGQAIRDAIAGGYEPVVFINENFNDIWTAEKQTAGVKAVDTFNQLQLLVTKIRAIQNDIKIITNTPPPVDSAWNTINTQGAQYNRRSDWDSVQEQLAQLITGDATNGTKRYSVADIARNTIYSATTKTIGSDPPQSVEGVHWTQFAIENKNVGPTWLSAWKNAQFGLAQPAPIRAAGTTGNTYITSFSPVVFKDYPHLVNQQGLWQQDGTPGFFTNGNATPAQYQPGDKPGILLFQYLDSSSGSILGYKVASGAYTSFTQLVCALWVTDPDAQGVKKLNFIGGGSGRALGPKQPDGTNASFYPVHGSYYGFRLSETGVITIEEFDNTGATLQVIDTLGGTVTPTDHLEVGMTLNQNSQVAFVQAFGLVTI